MNLKEITAFREELNRECEETLLKKGDAYTRGVADRLGNFKEVAKNLGITPKMAWAVYFHKHFDAVMYYLKTGKEGPEGVRENFKDLRNYIDLGMALIAEEKLQNQTFHRPGDFVVVDEYMIPLHQEDRERLSKLAEDTL